MDEYCTVHSLTHHIRGLGDRLPGPVRVGRPNDPGLASARRCSESRLAHRGFWHFWQFWAQLAGERQAWRPSRHEGSRSAAGPDASSSQPARLYGRLIYWPCLGASSPAGAPLSATLVTLCSSAPHAFCVQHLNTQTAGANVTDQRAARASSPLPPSLSLSET